MGVPWSWQLHCRAWVFLSSCSRSGQQSQNPPAILFPISFENRTRKPASCAQEVSAGCCHTQCAKKSRCRASNEHALTVTAAPVDSTRAAGEASLRGQSPGRGQSPSRLKTTGTRTFKMPCCQCTQGQLPSRGASGVSAADCSRQLRSPAQKCQLPVQGEVVMCVHAAFCQMALLRP